MYIALRGENSYDHNFKDVLHGMERIKFSVQCVDKSTKKNGKYWISFQFSITNKIEYNPYLINYNKVDLSVISTI